jgi:hypothetical protein
MLLGTYGWAQTAGTPLYNKLLVSPWEWEREWEGHRIVGGTILRLVRRVPTVLPTEY